MNSRSGSLRRSVMLAIFGVALFGFGTVAANAQYRDGYNYGRQNVSRHRHHDRCGHDQRRESRVYYGNGGYNNGGYYGNNNGYYNNGGYNNNGYYNNGGYNNGGYYNNSGYYPRRPVYRRSSGLSTILRLVIGGGGRRYGRHH